MSTYSKIIPLILLGGVTLTAACGGSSQRRLPPPPPPADTTAETETAAETEAASQTETAGPLTAQQVATRLFADFTSLGGDVTDTALANFDLEEFSDLPTSGNARFEGSALFSFDDAFDDEGFLSTLTLNADFGASTVDGRMTGFFAGRSDPAAADDEFVLLESEAYAGEVLITNGQIIGTPTTFAAFTGNADGTITAPDEIATLDFDMSGLFVEGLAGAVIAFEGTIDLADPATPTDTDSFDATGISAVLPR